MAQYASIHRSCDKTLFDDMFEAYKDKIVIPEQSKEADTYFYVQDTGLYMFLDDMRNSKDIINQKLDEITNMSLCYKGYEIELYAACMSGKIWRLYKLL